MTEESKSKTDASGSTTVPLSRSSLLREPLSPFCGGNTCTVISRLVSPCSFSDSELNDRRTARRKLKFCCGYSRVADRDLASVREAALAVFGSYPPLEIKSV